MYNHDPNFGIINSLKINDITISYDDLPECFKIISRDTCVISVPQEYHIGELKISGKNIWSGTTKTTLPEIDETMIDPPNRKVESLLSEGLFAEWIAVLLGLSLIILIGYVVYRKYRENQ